ncbi:MAG TPA: hypothetical protein VGN08_12360 [Solirubrobacteraceae bacterium]|jgi:hypothetical protein
MTAKRDALERASFGERIAEDEVEELARYFVETDQWRRLFSGERDIVYGPKGAGKSALYSLLVQKADELFDRGILVVPAENPNGTPAFRDVVAEPPTSEAEFVALWKLYFLSLCASILGEWSVETDAARRVYRALEDAGLLQIRGTLRARLNAVRDYVRRVSVEPTVILDPNTGAVAAVSGKITLREPDAAQRSEGFESLDSLLDAANEALRELDFRIWLVLDRLDVAFIQNDDLEQNALRALFKSYLDMKSLDQITLKIFLRTDIWDRITEAGFREASHITAALTISWDRTSLLQLMMRRILRNDDIARYYDVDPEAILGNIEQQESLLSRMFPDQIDAGRNPKTFDWMLGRTRDGTGATAPRELIHLLSSLRDSQLRRIEVGHDEPADEALFDRQAFKDALREVSNVRLRQTLYAEYPHLRDYISALEGQKAQQSPDTLAQIWQVEADEAQMIANSLVDIGFFEARGSGDRPEYWVPFLYRDALELIQGEARVDG